MSPPPALPDRPLRPGEDVSDYLREAFAHSAEMAVWLGRVGRYLYPDVLGDVELRTVQVPGCLLATRVRRTGPCSWRSTRFADESTRAARVFDFGPPDAAGGAVRFDAGEIHADPDRLGPGWRLFGLVRADHVDGPADRPPDFDRLAELSTGRAEVFAVAADPGATAGRADPGELLVRYCLAEAWRAAGDGPPNAARLRRHAAVALAAGRTLFDQEVWPATDDRPRAAVRDDVAAGPCLAWLREVAREQDRQVQGVLASLIEQFRDRAA